MVVTSPTTLKEVMMETAVTKRTILVVEDDEMQRRQVSRLLTAAGYEVFQAPSGDEAVRIVGEKKVDLVLTDRKMPGMDGVALLRYMRENHPDVPVVIITAYPEGIEDLDTDALLVKPFGGDQIREVVMRLLDAE